VGEVAKPGPSPMHHSQLQLCQIAAVEHHPAHPEQVCQRPVPNPTQHNTTPAHPTGRHGSRSCTSITQVHVCAPWHEQPTRWLFLHTGSQQQRLNGLIDLHRCCLLYNKEPMTELHTQKKTPAPKSTCRSMARVPTPKRPINAVKSTTSHRGQPA